MKHFVVCFLCCTSLFGQNTDRDKAWQLYMQGNSEEALTVVQHCKDTADYRTAFLKGKILESMYRYDDAMVAQQTALRLNAESVEARSALAALYAQTGRSGESAQLYGQLAEAYPSVNRWKINQAASLQAAGKYNEALNLLKIVTAADTTNRMVYKSMGDCLFRMDSLEQATVYYRKSLNIHPANKSLYGLLTHIYVLLNDPEKAVAVGNEAVAIDSTNVEAWKNLGVAWYRIGDPYRGIAAFRRTLALGDTSLTTGRHYGILCCHTAAYTEAEKYLSKALAAEPDNTNTMHYLAVACGYTGKAKRGLDLIDSINKIVALYDTVRFKAEVQRGYLNRVLYRYNDAVKSYMVAVKAYPKQAIYAYEVAVSYDMGLKKKQALDWYVRFLNQIDPGWETKNWMEEEKQKPTYQNTAMARVRSLKTDLFFEEEKKKK